MTAATMPRRHQRSRLKGSRLDEGVKYAGRPGKYGSPFHIARASRRGGPLDMWAVTFEGKTLGRFDARRAAAEDSVDRYRRYIDEQVGESGFTLAYEARAELAGLDLACWCPLTDEAGRPWPCHVDVLLRAANPEFEWNFGWDVPR